MLDSAVTLAGGDLFGWPTEATVKKEVSKGRPRSSTRHRAEKERAQTKAKHNKGEQRERREYGKTPTTTDTHPEPLYVGLLSRPGVCG